MTEDDKRRAAAERVRRAIRHQHIREMPMINPRPLMYEVPTPAAPVWLENEDENTAVRGGPTLDGLPWWAQRQDTRVRYHGAIMALAPVKPVQMPIPGPRVQREQHVSLLPLIWYWSAILLCVMCGVFVVSQC